MQLIIAAAAAVAAALAEFSLGPYLSIGTATPHLVLVFGVAWTVVAGLDGGLAWAFVGGVAIDAVAQRPLGSSAFALLFALGAASLVAGALGRARIIAPVVATFVCSLIYSMLLYITIGALQGGGSLPDPVATAVPAAIFDTVLAAIVGPLAVAIQLRRREVERAEW